MKLYHIASLALAASLAVLPVRADPIPLARISDYFNGFTNAEARFTQISDDGSVATGTLYIQRPGRMRFEYDPPQAALVMAGGGQVAIFDPKTNQPPEQYPLKRTPLNLILEPRVDLTRADMVVGHVSDDTTTSVLAQDPENPEYGMIRLVFTDDPVQLRQWVITDGAGGETTVILEQMELGGELSPRLFNITAEAEARIGRN